MSFLNSLLGGEGGMAALAGIGTGLGTMGLSTALGLGSSALAYKGQQDANKQNRDMATQQMVFQQQNSDTAHQREVRDLRAAGLNPILSGTGGSGASSPVGSSSVSHDAIGPAVNSGLTAFKLGFETAGSAAQTAKTIGETQNLTSPAFRQTLVNQAETSGHQMNSAKTALDQANLNLENDRRATELGKVAKQIEQLDLGIAGDKIKNKILDQNFEVAKADALAAKNRGEISASTYGKIMAYIEPLIPLFSAVMKSLPK